MKKSFLNESVLNKRVVLAINFLNDKVISDLC